jgi:hypothetical protein
MHVMKRNEIVKGKFLFITKHHATKNIGRVEV